MNSTSRVVLLGLTFLLPLQTPAGAQAQERPTVQIPQPGVPQIMTMEGRFVRAAYNNEGKAMSSSDTSSPIGRSARNGCFSRSASRCATECRTTP
jgi:hypothetical protein